MFQKSQNATISESKESFSQPQLRVEWYVVRVTYQRELVAQRLLEEMGIESFVPTQKVKRRKSGGGYYIREVAKVHNYLFVHTSEEKIKEIKQSRIPYLRLVVAPDGDRRVAQYVRAKEMEDFMRICRSEQAKYLEPEESLRVGDRVRILAGPLEGVEGIYVRTSARHEKRVVVQIEGVAAVATAAYKASEVVKIEN